MVLKPMTVSFIVRAVTPPLDYLLMSKGELYSHLINGNVATNWWGMSYSNRRELGLKIVQWWSYDYFDYQALATAYGGSNCTDPPTHDLRAEPEKNINRQVGLGMETASAYRHILFSDISTTKVPNNVFWWKQHWGGSIDSDEPEPTVWKCYEPGVRFGLPMAIALGAADWLNSLQVAEDVSKLESWIFFQTWLIDGYPGCDEHHWPLEKYGRSAEIWTIDSIDSSGHTRPDTKIATISW